jgi:hypothetical protein
MCKRITLDLYHKEYAENNSIWIRDLNVRGKKKKKNCPGPTRT